MSKKYKKHLPKILRKFHYPKLVLLAIMIILAYCLFKNPTISSMINSLKEISYIGTFISGLLLSFGFSAPLAVGFFITLKPESILLTAIIGGLGALISDLFIFNVIKTSFKEEFERLEKTKIMKELSHSIKNHLSHKIRNYILYTFAGILIASPLPDEAGVTILAGLTHIKQKMLAIIAFILHATGILIILLLSQ